MHVPKSFRTTLIRPESNHEVVVVHSVLFVPCSWYLRNQCRLPRRGKGSLCRLIYPALHQGVGNVASHGACIYGATTILDGSCPLPCQALITATWGDCYCQDPSYKPGNGDFSTMSVEQVFGIIAGNVINACLTPRLPTNLPSSAVNGCNWLPTRICGRASNVFKCELISYFLLPCAG